MSSVTTLLKDRNELPRSAYAVATRQGEDTNWPASQKSLKKSLIELIRCGGKFISVTMDSSMFCFADLNASGTGPFSTVLAILQKSRPVV